MASSDPAAATSAVLMANYNYGRFIADAVSSVLAQTTPPDQVVVVDDGSTDDSLEVLEAFGDAVTVVATENRGQPSALSTGFEHVTAETVFLMDSDDLFRADKVERCLEAFADHDLDWLVHGLREVSNVDERALSAAEHAPVLIPDDGRRKIPLPATSGLAFRRRWLEPWFPLPADLCVADNYLKAITRVRGSGGLLDAELGFLRLHGGNRYSGTRSDAFYVRSEVQIVDKLWDELPDGRDHLRRRFLGAVRYAIRSGSVSSVENEIRAFAQRLGTAGRVDLALRCWHWRMKGA